MDKIDKGKWIYVLCLPPGKYEGTKFRTWYQRYRRFYKSRNYKLEKIFVDKVSGKTIDRPRYTVLKEDVLREGDTLIIYVLDRFARNKKAISDELRYYEEHGIRVMILDIPTTIIDLPEETDSMNKLITEAINKS